MGKKISFFAALCLTFFSAMSGTGLAEVYAGTNAILLFQSLLKHVATNIKAIFFAIH
jgi:hypothetical protein